MASFALAPAGVGSGSGSGGRSIWEQLERSPKKPVGRPNPRLPARSLMLIRLLICAMTCTLSSAGVARRIESVTQQCKRRPQESSSDCAKYSQDSLFTQAPVCIHLTPLLHSPQTCCVFASIVSCTCEGQR